MDTYNGTESLDELLMKSTQMMITLKFLMIPSESKRFNKMIKNNKRWKMMKLDLNTEQLEFLQFILDNFEYNDDEERALRKRLY